ncbi:MAG: phenylalanine--tRNA ligase subunit beta [Rickettsiales bacterium]|jgi:phenylalanyl-tRNA synthetase beta chain|nr:phenylalanine--tRNA ligase subunit beta [Rickettsiales bacterium]
MKFTYNWLKDYLKTDKSPCELAEKLSSAGLEIEDLHDISENLKQFVVGEVIELNKHPDADKLNVLKVQAGDKIYDIVCGAPNVKKGMKSVLARTGDTIPLYNEKLKASLIRGVASDGMLCSEKELMISDNHEGIIELPSNAKHGENALNYFNLDAVFDGEITSNRPDYLGVIGIARDLAASGMGKFIDYKVPQIKSEFKSDVSMDLKAKETCPYFVAVVIKDLKNTKSPDETANRLKAIGINPKSFLIDITNYETIDKCRPMHAFDLDKLKGKFEIRYAKEGEKFVGLDDKEYTLSKEDCVFADAGGVQLLSGIMGAKNSGCDENTKNILLVCETLKPTDIRKTATRLKVESDAKYRFERGVDPASALNGIKVSTAEILKVCGGQASQIFELGTPYKETRKIKYSLKDFKKLIGIEIPKKEALTILSSLGFAVSENGDTFEIIPPSDRQDINESHDITEELIRIYGYDKIVPAPLHFDPVLKPTLTPDQINDLKIKRALCSMNVCETLSWSFVDSNEQELFLGEKGVEIANPITSNFDALQKTLLINLLRSVSLNQAKGNFNFALFRTGPVFYGTNPNEQETMTTCVLTGLSGDKNWQKTQKPYDVFDAKEKLFSVLNIFGLASKVAVIPANAPKYAHPKRFARVMLGREELAQFGQIHPYILKKLDIKGDVVFFQINQEKLPLKTRKQTALPQLKLSEFQSLTRDFAFIAPFEFASIDLINKVKGVDNLISKVSLFDDYDMKDGTKSLAINVVIQPYEKTLTDGEIELISNKIITTAETLGLKLR